MIGTGAVSMLAGVVLGLVIANVTTSFDNKVADIQQFSSNLIELDRVLEDYGPKAAMARAALKHYTELKLRTTWPEQSGLTPSQAHKLAGTRGLDELDAIGRELRNLAPAGAAQSMLQSRALELYNAITDARWALAETSQSSLQSAFLIVLIFWLLVVFIAFGLYAPPNGTVILILLLCAISFAGAIGIMLEMNTPFSGLMTISADPIREALARMGG